MVYTRVHKYDTSGRRRIRRERKDMRIWHILACAYIPARGARKPDRPINRYCGRNNTLTCTCLSACRLALIPGRKPRRYRSLRKNSCARNPISINLLVAAERPFIISIRRTVYITFQMFFFSLLSYAALVRVRYLYYIIYTRLRVGSVYYAHCILYYYSLWVWWLAAGAERLPKRPTNSQDIRAK